ncbi:MAG: metallophosphatase [Bacteroidales bacterium]|nr:metallophosphatase [Bacteroidales bacterium]
MKKLLFIFVSLLICGYYACGQTVDTLVILHTDDVHSQVEPKKSDDKGGAKRRMGAIEQVRAKYDNVLLLDAGDFTQGSSYYCVFKGRTDVELMNKMGYAAATLGNHEFDLGAEFLADSIIPLADFPIVLANYKFDKGFALSKKNVPPYVILDTMGLRIGIFGLLVDLQGLTAHSEIFDKPGMHYQNPVEVARKLSAKLKKQKKCDLVICLSHLGWRTETGSHPDELDGNIADLPFVDLVIGGHNHDSRPNSHSKDGTFFVQNKNQGVEIGIFKIPFVK